MEADVEMVPQTTTELTDPKHIEQMNKLIDNLEDLMMYKMCIITGSIASSTSQCGLIHSSAANVKGTFCLPT